MSKVLATVNSKEITENDLSEMINAYMQQTGSSEISNDHEKMLLQSLVQNTLLKEEADSRNIKVGDEILEQQLQAMYQQYGGQDNFEILVTQQGMDLDLIKKQIKEDLKSQLVAKEEIENKLSISEDELKAFYDSNSYDIKTDESFRASHILFSTEQDKEAAKEKAEEVLNEIRNNADFEEMAKLYSSCPSKQVGGDLNFFGKGQMVPEFEKAVVELDVGEVSGLVETQFGYHIIKKTDYREARQLFYNEAKSDIERIVRENKSREIIENFIEELSEKYEIQYM